MVVSPQRESGKMLMSGESLDLVFQSLASRSRRRIIDILKQRPGSSVNEVSQHFDTSRIAVMKHLAVLEEAQLIVSEKVGRTRRLYFNAEPIQQICQRWSSEYGQPADTEDHQSHRFASFDERDGAPHTELVPTSADGVGERNGDFTP
jgi:DNA-binding transcriptional ArsR family regulator